MIRGVHTMFYSSEPEAFRAFLRDKLEFSCTGDIEVQLYQPLYKKD